MDILKYGKNTVIGENVNIGNNVVIGHNCVIEDNVTIKDNSFIDSNSIIRSFTTIGANSNIGSNCIIGEYLMDFYSNHYLQEHSLCIGDNSLIRSGSIIYTDSNIGANFQTGHQVTIREKTEIGNNVSIGTLSDIQGRCRIGNYVRMHSNVHIGQLSEIEDFVWIFPYVILTNDLTPPSNEFKGVHIDSYAVVAAGAILLPGIELGRDCLIGAGAVVTKNVDEYSLMVGNPAKKVNDVRNVKNKNNGEHVYPWRKHFDKYMPWESLGFDQWYASLNDDERSIFNF